MANNHIDILFFHGFKVNGGLGMLASFILFFRSFPFILEQTSNQSMAILTMDLVEVQFSILFNWWEV